MTLIRYLQTPKYIAPRLSGNFSPLNFMVRRMASLYNVDIAGLTDEQIEVRFGLRREKMKR